MKPLLFLLLTLVLGAGCKKGKHPKMVDFTVPEINGGTCTLEDGQGKLLLVELFSYRCGYCRKQAKAFNELVKELDDSKVKVMAVHISGGEGVKSQVQQMYPNPKIKVCLDTGTLDRAIKANLPKNYHVRGIPHILLIKEGRVLRKLRGFHTKKALKTILNTYL